MSRLNTIYTQLHYSDRCSNPRAIRMQTDTKLGYSDRCPSGQWECFNSNGTSDCRDCNKSVFGTCMDDPWISCAGRHPGTSRNPPGDPNSGCNRGWYSCYVPGTDQKVCKACTSVAAGSGYCQNEQHTICGDEGSCPPGKVSQCVSTSENTCQWGCVNP